MLNQSKEVLSICVSFQQSRDLIKEEPESNVHDMFLVQSILNLRAFLM